jgi:hypothetical protein
MDLVRRLGVVLAAASMGIAAPLVVVPGCGGGEAGSPSTASGGVVGAAGGTVHGDGVTLTIPPGAVSDDVTITISRSSETVPSGFVGSSSVFVFGPDGLLFARPVTVQIPFTDGGGVATLFWSSRVGNGFDDVGGSAAGGVMTAQVTHFSRGFVGRHAGPNDDASAIDSSAPTDSSGIDGPAFDAPGADQASGGLDGSPGFDGSPGVDGSPGLDGSPGADASSGAESGSGTDAGPGGDAASDAGPYADSGADSGAACTCGAGQTCCLGVCVDTSASSQNCGHCGVSCGAGTCSSGQCSSCAVYGQSCASEACCTGTACISGTCTFPPA